MLLGSCKCLHVGKFNLGKRQVVQIFLPLFLISALITPITYIYLQLPPPPYPREYQNATYAYTPRWSWWLFEMVIGKPDPNFYSPERLVDLLDAPPMQTWDTPRLEDGAALLFLPIFSTGTASSRQRRTLIRSNSPMNLLPPAYRDLIELKFILGKPKPGTESNEEVTKEEAEIELEMAQYGDIARLDGLLNGDNMNEGKSWEWARWVGSNPGREAQWVIKCDDDTFPLLPNLIDSLLSVDPTQPTYFGTSMEHWTGYHFYFEGMMYGFSWHVVKTIAAAKRNEDAIHFSIHEDAHTGELMYSLPSMPDCKWEHNVRECDPETPPPGGWGKNPLSPDPRTGLVRHDFGHLLGPKSRWWVPQHPGKAIGWHGLKDDREYIQAYEVSMEYFTWEGYQLYTAKTLQSILSG